MTYCDYGVVVWESDRWVGSSHVGCVNPALGQPLYDLL